MQVFRLRSRARCYHRYRYVLTYARTEQYFFRVRTFFDWFCGHCLLCYSNLFLSPLRFFLRLYFITLLLVNFLATFAFFFHRLFYSLPPYYTLSYTNFFVSLFHHTSHLDHNRRSWYQCIQCDESCVRLQYRQWRHCKRPAEETSTMVQR